MSDYFKRDVESWKKYHTETTHVELEKKLEAVQKIAWGSELLK